MRTNRKPKDYFDNYLKLEEDDIDYFEHSLKNGEVKEEMIPSVKRKLFTQSLHLWIAKYSMGMPVEELKTTFCEVITRFKTGWKDKGNSPEDNIHFDNYMLMLWMLSLGVLLNIEQTEFEKLVDVLEQSNREDYFFDQIIAYRIPERTISTKITYPDQFMFLKNLICTKSVSELKNYLDKSWYSSIKHTYWHNNDKSTQHTFFGYWSFETAVFIKITGLDDAIIKDQEYYPYDLVHQNF
ncbi:Domain of uncharacterised function (DUF1911) [Sphingobacterium spiritivorum]|uniref:Domain of uncharacterized function (DUF1911) n=1 Tax=Sphingobacterium spiritivorum TaxID=258 RepID=A0A380BQJ9_SPHSI|nr:PoNe immunity protein domain-containing protein [Sphingobacterium spiritivorum]SUJ04690.1 Domain of uncharacterised function (DUF1911) [Sphingobacterium spiritivorum]